jgi:hypothetical protein
MTKKGLIVVSKIFIWLHIRITGKGKGKGKGESKVVPLLN